MTDLATNVLYYGDNLDILRRYLPDDTGNEFGFHGVFHSNDPDNMVQTFEFEGMPGHVSLDKLALEDIGGGRTRAHMHSVYQSLEDRDGIVQPGWATAGTRASSGSTSSWRGCRFPSADGH